MDAKSPVRSSSAIRLRTKEQVQKSWTCQRQWRPLTCPKRPGSLFLGKSSSAYRISIMQNLLFPVLVSFRPQVGHAHSSSNLRVAGDQRRREVVPQSCRRVPRRRPPSYAPVDPKEPITLPGERSLIVIELLLAD